VEVGSPVTAGSALLTITDVSTLSLSASVDETDVLLVRSGVAADVELDAVPGASYAATVRSVDLQPTTSARGGVSYLVRLGLSAGRTDSGAAAPAPRPGMSAVVRLKVRTATDAISVPAAAVFRDGARDAVWVLQDGTARRREVDLGAQGDDLVEVARGLSVGESVVVKGADRVADGQRVEPQ
ncbi:MAG: efflux RND transporter periplasmic adaptor subunit, partial [Kineosporiaceae bacterium]